MSGGHEQALPWVRPSSGLGARTYFKNKGRVVVELVELLEWVALPAGLTSALTADWSDDARIAARALLAKLDPASPLYAGLAPLLRA